MSSYERFAELYDSFMQDIPYDEWRDYIIEILAQNDIFEGATICELGCGTGQMTRRLRNAGFPMIGLDLSYDMLSIALEDSGNILYLSQDIRGFELHGPVEAFISVCDTINYLTNPKDLLQTFTRVSDNLLDGGVFIFDIKSVYTYEHILGNNTFADNDTMGSYIWENYYSEISKINQYDLTLFIKDGDMEESFPSDTYHKFEETHMQRAYDESEIVDALEKAGLTLINMCDANNHKPVTATTERILFTAKKEK